MTTTTATQREMTTFTREEWLNLAAHAMINDVIGKASSTPVPPYRLSVGWPYGTKGGKNFKVLGQCFPRSYSSDNTNEIFISPTTGGNDSLKVLHVLLHELLHAYDDCQSGHRGAFARLAKACGLLAPMTTTTPDATLTAYLNRLIERLGEIPHAALDTSKIKPKQKNRQLLVECTLCDFKFRASKTTIETMTVNICLACGTTDALKTSH